MPERVLSKLFRGKLRDQLAQAGLLPQVPANVWLRDWTVDAKAVGDGRASLKYLAPYVFRGPVSDWRVTECCWSDSLENATLTLQVKRSGDRRYRGMSLSVTEFIRRWLQHVLPAGFHRVRYYGFLNPHSRFSLEDVRWLIAIASGLLHYLACSQQLVAPKRLPMRCPNCGGAMISLGYTPPPVPTAVAARAPP